MGPTFFGPKESAAKAGMVPNPPPEHIRITKATIVIIDDEVAEMVSGWNHSYFSKLALVLTSFPSQNAPNCEKVEAGASRSQTTLSFDDET